MATSTHRYPRVRALLERMKTRPLGGTVALAPALVLGLSVGAAPATAPAATTPKATAITTSQPSISKMVGQLLIGRFAGTTPPAAFLARIRAGQLGSVILFSDNTAGGLSATRTLIARLQAAAKQGGNPPLLIMTDQEGGEVRRLPGAPALNADQMTSTTMARAQGVAAGRLLRSVGVNVDLAPVADVEANPNSFLGPRAFGTTPATVAARACAFAGGLASTGVAYTLKHFPGLGLASVSTDLAPVTIRASASVLRAAYAAYTRCGNSPRALVMVSSAIYPTLTGSLPAVESPLTYSRELPLALHGHTPLTVSDDLQAGALTNQTHPALHALDAGLDLAMYATNSAGSAAAFPLLVADVRSGQLSRQKVAAADAKIAALKALVAKY